ncbi:MULTISPECIES: TRAP transporter substrate-binding protein [unclassified Oscillibacter]|uniref:TRAP transporter substrate-binding protein n=1 Tax=unclassified Oscillibacter TaxID=2629304 RepID=UPI0025F95DD5|nr:MULTISPECIES: TRAP transporter substrate-binding protein [unclassified Oscillibacter]
MKKKILAALLCAAMCASLLASCGGNSGSGNGSGSAAAAGQSYTMKMHLSLGETDPVYKSAEVFAKTVNEKTGGTITVELYPSSSLGNTADCLEGLSLGICNIVYESIGNLASMSSLANVEAAPYLYSGVDHWKAVWEGEIGQDILTKLGEDCGMTLTGAGLQGVRVMCSNKRIETPADVAGFKLRVPTIPIYLDTWQWLGATPTPLGGSEVFTAIQQGTVNGAENGLTNIASLSWDESCDYIIETNHVYNTVSFIMDKNYFASLPAEYQTIIQEASVEAGKYCTDLVMDATESVRPEVEAAGCEFIDTDVSLWQQALDGFLEAKYPDLVSYADAIKAADPA